MPTQFSIRQLVDLLNAATKQYEEGNPTLTDKEWDNYYFELQKREQKEGIIYADSPTQTISYQINSSLKEVQHNHAMLSLDKTKDWNTFLQYFDSKDVVGMLKLDGLTCSITYKNGKIHSAETRGNGYTGEDILSNILTLPSVPIAIPYKDTLVIDGEIICQTDIFQTYFSEYSTPRNFASGSIRLLDSQECSKRKLSFIAWDVPIGLSHLSTVLDRFNYLNTLGFLVVPWTSSFDWDAKEFLIDKAKELNYPIDGLVGRFNDINYGQSLGATSHHSKAAYAFKFYDNEYETHLLDIEWSLGRTGILTPIAIYEAVDIDGSICNRASLHNLSVLFETMNGGAYVNEPITVAKMNMIIPQVIQAATTIPKEAQLIPLPTQCPVCGGAVIEVISDAGIRNLCCGNPVCEGKLINQLDHFAGKQGLDIKGLSKATLSNLINWGYITCIKDLFDLCKYQQEWMKKPGYGKVSVNKILAAIEASKECSAAAFISALGIPLIGKSVAKDLMAIFDNSYWNFRDAIQNNFNFSSCKGFADSKTQALLTFDYTEADQIATQLTFIKTESSSKNLLDNVSFVISGSLSIYKNRAELTSVIEALGGKVVSSVSANTTYLISNETVETNKTKTAKRLGVTIITEQEFYDKYILSV